MNKTFDILETIDVVEEPQFLIDFRTKPVTKEKKETKTLKAVSLFSGCDGLDLGFTCSFTFRDMFYKKNNFRIEFANDIDQAAEFVYNSNK
jgi:hypothetical protein